MSAQAHKAIVMRLFEELNRKNIDILLEIVAPGYVEEKQQFYGAISHAFPDFQVTVDDLVADDEKVAIRYSMTGTHQGQFLHVPATGKQVSITGMQFFYFSEGKIVKHLNEIDTLILLQQMGVIPAFG